MNSKFIIMLLILLLAMPGCSIHFKGEKLELDSEPTTRVHNTSYELDRADFL